MRISDWSSDVCSSDLPMMGARYKTADITVVYVFHYTPHAIIVREDSPYKTLQDLLEAARKQPGTLAFSGSRSEEHTSELQSLMRISYAIFCLKKKTKSNQPSHARPHRHRQSPNTDPRT